MRNNSIKQQIGAALITSLLMVLVIAILGIAVGQQVISLRKVSAINYDNVIGRNNAQSALSEGLSVLEENSLDPDTLSELAQELQSDSNWWRTESNWASATSVTSINIGDPQYLIEDAGTDEINLEMDSTGKIERHFYRVTAKAQGKGEAIAFLQSYYVTVE